MSIFTLERLKSQKITHLQPQMCMLRTRLQLNINNFVFNFMFVRVCHEKLSPATRKLRLSVTKNDHFLTLYQGEVIKDPL